MKFSGLFCKVAMRLTASERERQRERERFREWLIADLQLTLAEMKNAVSVFNEVVDNDLIDSVIFAQRSLSSRYAYLLRLAKENNIKV